MQTYDAIMPTYPMDSINPADAPYAAQSAAQNLEDADRIDEQTFNRAIWAAVNGPDSVMPAPRYDVMGPPMAGVVDGDDD